MTRSWFSCWRGNCIIFFWCCPAPSVRCRWSCRGQWLRSRTHLDDRRNIYIYISFFSMRTSSCYFVSSTSLCTRSSLHLTLDILPSFSSLPTKLVSYLQVRSCSLAADTKRGLAQYRYWFRNTSRTRLHLIFFSSLLFWLVTFPNNNNNRLQQQKKKKKTGLSLCKVTHAS